MSMIMRFRRRTSGRSWRFRLARSRIALFLIIMTLGWTETLERFAYQPSRDSPDPPLGVDEVYFESADGTRLHGWFAAAKPAISSHSGEVSDVSPIPTVLVIHGNAGNVSNHYGFVGFLPRAGFNVLIFDYRGYGRSEDKTMRRKYLYF